tara:strand:- start:28982 stop:29509 length:528 start_codon:yes stop_codon:yes gene_type:complete
LAEIDILEMRKLVSALETSDQGSPVLDLELKCGLGLELPPGSAMASTGLEAEFAPGTVEIILGEMVNPYSRSLDAALPGENIVFSMYSTIRKLWVSVHRDTDDREFVSWAATEPLSRRAAALRGLASISTDASKAEPVSLLRAESRTANGPNGLQDTPSPQMEADGERRDWQVNF